MTRRARNADSAALTYPQFNPFGEAQAPHAAGRFEEDNAYTEGQILGILVMQVKESGIFDVDAWVTYTISSGSQSNLALAVITGNFTVNGSAPVEGFVENPDAVAGGTEEIVGRAFDNAASGETATLAMTDLTTTGAAKGAFVGFLLIAHVTGEGANITVDGTGAPAGSIKALELS